MTHMSVAQAFAKPRHSLPTVSDALAIPSAKIGVEIECEKVMGMKGLSPLWQAKEDHSLKDRGMEFVTAGGLVGKELTEALAWFCKYATDMKYSNAYPRGGIHIHVDVTDMNEADDFELARMIQTSIIVEPAMFSYAGENRRACGFCDAYGDSDADFDALSKVLFKWGTPEMQAPRNLDRHRNVRGYSLQDYFIGGNNLLNKYQAVNLLPMAQFGTIEYRHLPTTFNYQRILDWINVILCIKRFSQEFKGDVTKHASEIGGPNFFDQVFGKWVPVMGPHYRDDAFAEALIQAKLIQLRSRVKAYTPKTEDWPGKQSSLFTKKLAKFKPKTKKEAELAVKEKHVGAIRELQGAFERMAQPGRGLGRAQGPAVLQWEDPPAQEFRFVGEVPPPEPRVIRGPRDHHTYVTAEKRGFDTIIGFTPDLIGYDPRSNVLVYPNHPDVQGVVGRWKIFQANAWNNIGTWYIPENIVY